MRFKSEPATSDLNGFLDSGSHIQGELRFENTFRIDGRFTGRISSEGTLVVGERGQIDGEIEVDQVLISGLVQGHVRARRKVQIAPEGKVYAELDTAALVIEEGAVFEGRCAMSRRERPAAASVRTSSATPEDSSGKDATSTAATSTAGASNVVRMKN